MGSGYLLSQLNLVAGCRCVGLDRLTEAIAVSRETSQRSKADVALVRGSGFLLPFADGSFDVVVSLGVIEHFPPEGASALLREHARVCRPNGRVIVSVPNTLDVAHTLLRWLQGKAYRYYPERSYTPWRLSSELRKVGLLPTAADGYAPLWSLRQHRWGYPLTAALHKTGLLDRLDGLGWPRALSWMGSLTLQVASKRGEAR